MKKIYFITLLLFSLAINLTCTKDEIIESEKTETPVNLPASIEEIESTQTNTGLRDGEGDIIFYRTSLTTDNYLLLNTTNRIRTHKVYNKSKIKGIKFVGTGKPDVRVGSVLMSHYKIEILYIDNSIESLTAYSKKYLTTFTFIPTGDNILSNTNTAKFISYETTGTSSITYYNPLRDETYPLYKWTIKRENVIITIREIEPLNKNSKQFMIIHLD